MMTRKLLYIACFLMIGTSHSLVGASPLRRGVTPSLKQGELIRLEAKVGEIKGGHAYIYAKKVKRTRSGIKMLATIKARTNTFFDKIHKVNNRFRSQFRVCGRQSGFRYDIDVDQAGTVMTRSVKFTPRGLHSSLALNAFYKSYRGKKYNRRYRSKKRVPVNTFNLVSAIYHARFLPYQQGKEFSFYIFSTGRLWHLTGALTRRTKIHSILGKKRALLITAYARKVHRGAKKRQIKIWLTDDARRIPLKIQGHVPFIGTATAVLHGYRRSLRSRYIDGTPKKSSGWGFLSTF